MTFGVIILGFVFYVGGKVLFETFATSERERDGSKGWNHVGSGEMLNGR